MHKATDQDEEAFPGQRPRLCQGQLEGAWPRARGTPCASPRLRGASRGQWHVPAGGTKPGKETLPRGETAREEEKERTHPLSPYASLNVDIKVLLGSRIYQQLKPKLIPMLDDAMAIGEGKHCRG